MDSSVYRQVCTWCIRVHRNVYPQSLIVDLFIAGSSWRMSLVIGSLDVGQHCVVLFILGLDVDLCKIRFWHVTSASSKSGLNSILCSVSI